MIDDRSYFRLRAEIEVERAQQVTHPRAVAAHHQLAEADLDKLAVLEQPEAERS